MATTRTANAHWEGSLFEGKGRVSLDSSGVGAYDVSWPARTEDPNGMTSPEELIAAAHSSCFSMAFANQLTKAGYTVESVDTKAEVTFQPGTGITGSHLTTRASVAVGDVGEPGEAAGHRPDSLRIGRVDCIGGAAQRGDVELAHLRASPASPARPASGPGRRTAPPSRSARPARRGRSGP